MKKANVLILIEHVARELESAILMKIFFERKGYLVNIDSIKFNKERIILKYNPDIVIVPWAYTNKDIDLFRSFVKNKKIILLNMHHEQISNDGSDSFIIPRDDAKDVLHLSWGEKFSNKLLESGCDRNTIIQCGNPRLDFYKKGLVNVSKDKDEISNKYDLDKSKKWVLFIANSFHLLTKDQIKINLDKGVDIEEQIYSSKKNRIEFLDYVDTYLSKNNDVEFIYRPHPSFSHIDSKREEIVKLEKKYKNFKCISKGSIRDWIINSDIAISFHSTSVIECCLSKCEFYLMRKYKLDKSKDYKFFKDYEYKIEKYSDFEDAVKQKNRFNYNAFLQQIKEEIDLNINYYTTEEIVERIDYMYKDNRDNFTKIDFKLISHFQNIVKSNMKKIITIILKIKFIKKYLLKKNDIRIFNLLYEGDDYFDKKDVTSLQDIIKNKGRLI